MGGHELLALWDRLATAGLIPVCVDCTSTPEKPIANSHKIHCRSNDGNNTATVIALWGKTPDADFANITDWKTRMQKMVAVAVDTRWEGRNTAARSHLLFCGLLAGVFYSAGVKNAGITLGSKTNLKTMLDWSNANTDLSNV